MRKGSKTTFQNNSIIRFSHSEDGKETFREMRVLLMDSVTSILINIDKDVAADPEYFDTLAIKAALENGKAEALDYDPIMEHLLIDEEKISEASKKRQSFFVRVIHSIVYINGKLNFDIFDPKKRAELIKLGVENSKKWGKEINKKTVLRKLRVFFRGGMVDKALYPNFENCGAPGQYHNSTDKKIGRKSSAEKRDGRVEPLYDQVMLRMIFLKELETHYGENINIQQVLDIVVKKYFTTGVEVVNGIPNYNFVNEKYFPTYEQIYHFYRKEWRKDPIKFLKKKYGERRYNKDKRPKLGRELNKASGPGFLYQGDSTIGDCYLVYTHDRSKIIGRPLIYPLIDDCTQLLAGFSVTIENASWITFLLALDNAYSDKVKFCAEYGITITKSMWPSEGLPAAIKGDRAELISHSSSKLKNLSIRIDNAAAYRPDWKGLVEKWIHLINLEAQHIPGGITHPHKRGEKDVRLLACLTPEEFIKALVHFILFYNNYHVIKDYPRTAGMLKDKLKCTPTNLWAWGIENLTGELRDWDRDDVMLNLLPEGTASITEDKGFLFKGKTYHSGLPEEQVLSVIAQEEGRRKFKVVYDPRRPETIFCQFSDRKRFTPLYLSDNYRPFRGLHEMEWDNQNDMDLIQSDTDRRQEQMARLNKDLARETIVTPAQKEAEAAREGMSKSAQVENIRGNRQLELAREREETPLLPSGNMPNGGNSNDPNLSGLTQDPKEINKCYIPRPSRISVLEEVEMEEEDASTG